MEKKRLICPSRRPVVHHRQSNRICSWCGRNLGLLPYSSNLPSFGICDDCVIRNFAYLYDPPIVQEIEIGGPQDTPRY
jgi:hypothetical protein